MREVTAHVQPHNLRASHDLHNHRTSLQSGVVVSHRSIFKSIALISAVSLFVAIPVVFYAEMEMQRISLDAARNMERELTKMVAKDVAQPVQLGFSGTVDEPFTICGRPSR